MDDIADRFSFALECLFLFSSSISNFFRAGELLPILSWTYVVFVLLCLLSWSKIRQSRNFNMFTYPFSVFNLFIFITLQLSRLTNAQSLEAVTTSIQSGDSAQTADLSASPTSSGGVLVAGTTSSFRPIFTVPTDADSGATLIPNINDPEAVDAQTFCPGYNASNVERTTSGLTATLTLAREACNVYGTDIETLNLTVEYQSEDRLAVQLVPSNLGSSNSSQYLLPSEFVYQPTVNADAGMTSSFHCLETVRSPRPTVGT
ncbi:MAG: hypothetical protein Q9205_003242 [Flavoplaca limonia]